MKRTIFLKPSGHNVSLSKYVTVVKIEQPLVI